uniref:Uncharacterized protein n=1 Tax=Zooxanthella nutricula TaxID=1333877 RepID=A0A7S2J4F9_9DINO|mmetsp:Transcript_2603/g.7850  ORF Transcript_2603/g.7850 Transcript_2603/m.7850 type:complete len:175 (+) Transcript_2603:101-625(+)
MDNGMSGTAFEAKTESVKHVSELKEPAPRGIVARRDAPPPHPGGSSPSSLAEVLSGKDTPKTKVTKWKPDGILGSFRTIFTLTSGSGFDGEWTGRMEEERKQFFLLPVLSDGPYVTYEGQFKGLCPHGRGTQYSGTEENVVLYSGEFKDGSRTGNGTYYRSSPGYDELLLGLRF